MNGWARRALGVGCAAVLLVGLGALSRLPYAPGGHREGVIRLSWRWREGRVQVCRAVDARELARQPVHMRRPVVCERRVVPYRLRVALDGVPVLDERVAARGLLGDRPLSVLRELRAAPGSHRLSVSFVPEPGRVGEARAPSGFDTVVVVVPRRVVLVTVARLEGDRPVLRVGKEAR